MTCEHQFFKTQDLSYQPFWEKEINGKKQLFTEAPKTGTQVMCVLCGEQRQVWSDGKINIYNNKKRLWEQSSISSKEAA